MKYITTIGEEEFQVEILGSRNVSVNGVVYEVDFEPVSGQPVYSLLVNNSSYHAHIYEGEADALQVMLRGTLYTAFVEDERERRLKASAGGRIAESGEFILKAPMPGLVVNVPVSVGEEVKQGDVLVILESMKMQNELKAPREGKVSRIQVKASDSVEQKQSLVYLEKLG